MLIHLILEVKFGDDPQKEKLPATFHQIFLISLYELSYV